MGVGMNSWRLFIFSLNLIFLSHFAQAQQAKYLEQMHIFNGTQLISNNLFASRPPDFDQLQKDKKQFHDPDSFLKYLSKKSPKALSNYVLVHNSESQQLSSLEEPRILLFQGGIAYGLSNHPAQKDKRVEIMQVEPETYKISMHEIVFTAQGPRFEKNPKSCAACHGVDPKPLWNPYDFWPNSFGGAIGQIGTQEEQNAYEKLTSTAATHPLLKYLKFPNHISLDSENITGFTQFIHQINLGRWINQNIREDKLNGYAEALIANLGFCANNMDLNKEEESKTGLQSFFRPEEWPQLSQRYDSVNQDVHKGREFFKSFLDQTLFRIFPNPKIIYQVDHSRLISEVKSLSQMYTVLSAAGIDTSNLTTSLFGNDVLISAPSNFPIDFLTSLYVLKPKLFSQVTVLPEDMHTSEYHWVKVDCNSVKTASLQAQRQPASTEAWKSFREVKDSRPPLSRCAKCHVENQTAPYIPFEQPLKLAQWLRDPKQNWAQKIKARINAKGTSQQMPPTKALSAEEITAVEAFVDVLQ